MKISIVTISYNQKNYLKQCMDSVLSQRKSLAEIGVELEYIVVDPGSTDGSRELIEGYGDNIITVFEKDNGPADGLNKGFAIATSDVFAYINSDDYFLPNVFKIILKKMEEENCDVFCGHGWIVDADGQRVQRCFSHKFSLAQYALGNCVVMQPSTFFKRNVYLQAGGFNPHNKISWDGELVVDMALQGAKIYRDFGFYSAFRVYDESISGSGKFINKANIQHIKIAEKINSHVSFYKNFPLLQRLLFRLADPKLLLYRIVDQIKNGRRLIPKS